MRSQHVALLALLTGCAAAPGSHLLLAAPPRALDASRAVPAPASAQNITSTELDTAASASLSLVQIRDRETAHIHTRYDLAVTLLAGEGVLWLDGAPLPMRRGDVAFIPRSTPHYFVSQGPTPALAAVVFAPPFSGPDQAPVP
jgi:quercetin dioxygenase-like cupin family protein